MKKLLFLLALIVSPAHADTNITVPYNTANTIQFELRDREGATPGLDLEAAATCATGDVTFLLDGDTTPNNTTNCFSHLSGGIYELDLVAGEVNGKVSTLKIVDQTGTKVWVDKVINLYTHGNASSFHGVSGVNVTQIEGADPTDTIDSRTNAQVLDVLNTDTFAELSTCPTFPMTIRTMLQIQAQWTIFKKDKDSGTALEQLYKDNGTTPLCERPYSDSGTVRTLGEYVVP
jgi:hypothetical protein